MVTESCTKEKLRDTTWGNWKRRAKEKLDKSRQTGRGKVILSEPDNLVLDILGRDTPGVVGMIGVSSDSEDADEDTCKSVVATNSSSGKTNKGKTTEEPPKPTLEKEKVINSKPSSSKSNNVIRQEGRYNSPLEKKTKLIDDEMKVLDKQKIAQINYLNASADLVNAQKYKTQLECLALERQLQLPTTAVTANLMALAYSGLSQVLEEKSFSDDDNHSNVITGDGVKIYRNLN